MSQTVIAGRPPSTAELPMLERARSMRGLVESEAAASEQLRTLSPAVVEAMWETGLMTAMNPVEAGGIEPSFRDMIETWIEMASQDASFGWVGIANFPEAAIAAACLPDEGFDEIFGSGRRVTTGGQLAPNGMGAVVDGGYRLSGSWNFGSGSGHSEYIGAGFVPMDGGEVVWLTEGTPDIRVALLPRSEVTFTDGWHVQGLKATGSYDYNVQDVFVPACRQYPLFTREPLRGSSPAFRMGLMSVTAAGHSSWALGVARSMLEDVEEVATSRVRMGDDSSIANRPSFQTGFGRHESMWRAARLLVLEAFETVEASVAAGDPLTPRQRAELRTVSVYATDVARAVVEWAHLAAGTTAIREGTRLERAFRDIYTGTQHFFIGERIAADAAQVRLGIADDKIGL